MKVFLSLREMSDCLSKSQKDSVLVLTERQQPLSACWLKSLWLRFLSKFKYQIPTAVPRAESTGNDLIKIDSWQDEDTYCLNFPTASRAQSCLFATLRNLRVLSHLDCLVELFANPRSQTPLPCAIQQVFKRKYVCKWCPAFGRYASLTKGPRHI